MPILTQTDFTGKYALSQGMYSTANIEDYINKYENKYLTEMLGVELYNDFMTDLAAGSGTPTEVRFLVIWNALNYDYSNYVYQSEGIKLMLIGYVYFEYLRDTINQISPIGNVRPVGENSDTASTLFSTMYNRYNNAVRTQFVIQKYIDINTENYDYDKYNGQSKSLTYWL